MTGGCDAAVSETFLTGRAEELRQLFESSPTFKCKPERVKKTFSLKYLSQIC